MKRIFVWSILAVWLFGACLWDKRSGTYAPDFQTNVSIIRYDKLLDEYITSGSFSSLQKLNMDYRQLTTILIEDILELGEVSDDTISQKLRAYYSDSTLMRLTRDVEEKFADLSLVEKQLDRAFAYLSDEFPGTRLPRFYAQISAFNESVVLSDSLIGISLDKYMGTDYPLYTRFYYKYQRATMKPDRIAPDCIRFYLTNRYPFQFDSDYCFLDLMIYSGKINYITRKALGYKDAAAYLDYTEAEKAWCEANEKNIWKYMIMNRHLQATDPMVMRKYLRPAPFTAFFGDQAPQMLGVWIGMRIVESYMKSNPQVSVYELLTDTDSRKLLQSSNYLHE